MYAHSNATEIGARGEAIYAQLKTQTEVADKIGAFIAIDVETAQFEITEQLFDAAQRLRDRLPDAVICTFRIGYPAAVSMGGRMEPAAI